MNNALTSAYIFFSLHYTVCIVIMGAAMLGMTAGSLGCFAFLRKQSLLGDAISHASLPGIALMFLITHSKNPYVLLSGGALSGGIGTLLIMLIVQKSSLKKDTALGIILSVFFGLGLVLLTFIQKKAIAQQALLNKFLFGNASTLLLEEVYCIVGLSLFILTCIMLFWKEFKLITFDPLLARSLGYSVVALDCWLTFLLVLGITIGLQTVGVVLMSTLFIAPAVAARQWVCSFGSLLVLAGFFGALSAIIGVIVSSLGDHMPTGPMIVIIMSSIVFLSLCCAPRIHRMRKKKYEYSA